jgi:hypothetical protein
LVFKQPLHLDKHERLMRVGSVSSLMQEAAAGPFDAATVSNPPHC